MCVCIEVVHQVKERRNCIVIIKKVKRYIIEQAWKYNYPNTSTNLCLLIILHFNKFPSSASSYIRNQYDTFPFLSLSPISPFYIYLFFIINPPVWRMNTYIPILPNRLKYMLKLPIVKSILPKSMNVHFHIFVRLVSFIKNNLK